MENKSDLLIAIVVATSVMMILSAFVLYFVIIYRKKQQNFEREREVFKQALMKTEIEIKEQTLSDISRELHDNIGQIASLIKINLNLVLPNLQSEDHEKVDESLQLLKQLIKDIQSVSVSLKGENLKRFGFLGMMERDIERYQKTAGLTIQLSSPASMPELDPAVEIFLYRMSQEIFNNIIKHAKATEVNARLAIKNKQLILSFQDNGVGFDPAKEINGSGLINLKERCKMIHADFDLHSEPNAGTKITITLNLEQ
jgi:signal transduction histidine kinase